MNPCPQSYYRIMQVGKSKTRHNVELVIGYCAHRHPKLLEEALRVLENSALGEVLNQSLRTKSHRQQWLLKTPRPTGLVQH